MDLHLSHMNYQESLSFYISFLSLLFTLVLIAGFCRLSLYSNSKLYSMFLVWFSCYMSSFIHHYVCFLFTTSGAVTFKDTPMVLTVSSRAPTVQL